MNIEVKSILASSKPHRLADACVELTDHEGDRLVIFDLRILRNRQGQIWVAVPSRSVTTGGRSFQWFPVVEPNHQLRRKIEDAVLTAFDEWKQQSQPTGEVR